MRIGIAVRLGGAGRLVLPLALAACGLQAPTAEPTAAVRPPIPEGWRLITAERDKLSLAVPADLVVTNTSGSISALRERSEVAPELIVSAIGPGRVDQRLPGESVLDWVVRGNWLTAGRGEQNLTSQREVSLPSGPALEMTSAYGIDGEERWTMLHVIDTGNGYAVIQFDGTGPAPAEPTGEIRLMRELADFSP